MTSLRPLASLRRVLRRHFAGPRAVAVLCVVNWVVVRALTARAFFRADMSTLDIVESTAGVLILLAVLANRRLVQAPQARRVEAMTRQLTAANARLIEQARLAREELAELEEESAELETQADELLKQRNDMLGVHDALLFQQDATANAQAMVAEREARYRSVVESLNEGVILQDAQGHIVAWNSSAQRILGLSAEELPRRCSHDPDWVCMNEDGEPMPADEHPIRRALRTGVPQRNVILSIMRPDGTRRWLSVNAQTVTPVGAEAPSHGVASFSDITDARESAANLARLSVIVQQSEELVVITAKDGRIEWANDAWCRHTGYALDEVLGQMPGALLDGPETNTLDVGELQAAAEAGVRWSGELVNYRKDGTTFAVELSISPLRNERGDITAYFSIERDITERRASARERQRFMAALAVTADGVAITSETGTMEFVNHALARLHGYRPDELIGRDVMSLLTPEEGVRFRSIARDDIENHGSWHGTIASLRKDGNRFPADLSLAVLPSGGEVYALRDITDYVASKDALQTLSLHDELTGLYNRRGFFGAASQQLAAAARTGVPCLLLYGDLDRFKAINDTLGHDAGDQALKDMANLFRASLRESDIVARLGGDEFTVLVVNATEGDEQAVRTRLSTMIDDWNASSGRAWTLALSLGVARFDPAQPAILEALMREADERLYANKATRRLARAA